ncbi:hypothetical protein FIBSPDRAFT_890401 [Athelia psychrophila]|uniref:Uncharacterized protein n=1 Tax=Athelia psychrophila TaxID=1759441 RepID=A0A166L319_9AGAM|nr:hypothetical protein FIBSPDRAFT_890401 [Fibularhizoctonia sp. CBS 109695]
MCWTYSRTTQTPGRTVGAAGRPLDNVYMRTCQQDMPAPPDKPPKRVLRSESKPDTGKPRPAPRKTRKKRTISSAATVEDSTTSIESEDSASSPRGRNSSDRFSASYTTPHGTTRRARFLSRAPPGAVHRVEICWQHLPRDLVPIIPLTTRVGEAPHGMYDTPQRKVIAACPPLITPGMDLEESQLYDVGLAAHEPCPDNPDGRPWVQQYDEVSHVEWRLGGPRVNRFMQAPMVKSKQASTSDAVAVHVQAPRKSTHNYHAQFDGEDLLERKMMSSYPLPLVGLRASGTTEPTSAAPRGDKGKAPERHARAGPSTGSPSFEVTEELERVGHKMQAEVNDLADKFGLSYETILRKIGFARQQEVQEPNVANIFRKVHKHRLAAASEPTQTAAQYNTAFTGWQEQHGDDPDAVAALLQEHANILASDTKTSRPSDIPKRVSVISQQMADMSNSYFMTSNIVVVGAVIHLGAAHAAQTFAPNMGQQVALVNGFDIDQEAVLLKAKALLLQVQTPHEQVETAMPNSRWIAGASPRDNYRLWVKGLLKKAFANVTNPPATWNFKKFPQLAEVHELVLTGWGPNMCSVPNHDWIDQKAGGLTQANWHQLVRRIPSDYYGNPHHRVDEGELSLEFVPLAEFLEKNPKYAGRRPCLVNHVGKAIYFAGEDKPALKGTAPKKSVKSQVPKITAPESSASDESSEEDPPAVRARYISVESSSPSGHVRKRARVAASTHGSDSPPPAKPERPVKSMPARPVCEANNDKAEKRKRKHSGTDVAVDRGDDASTRPEAEHGLHVDPVFECPATKLQAVFPIPDNSAGGDVLLDQWTRPDEFAFLATETADQGPTISCITQCRWLGCTGHRYGVSAGERPRNTRWVVGLRGRGCWCLHLLPTGRLGLCLRECCDDTLESRDCLCECFLLFDCGSGDGGGGHACIGASEDIFCCGFDIGDRVRVLPVVIHVFDREARLDKGPKCGREALVKQLILLVVAELLLLLGLSGDEVGKRGLGVSVADPGAGVQFENLLDEIIPVCTGDGIQLLPQWCLRGRRIADSEFDSDGIGFQTGAVLWPLAGIAVTGGIGAGATGSGGVGGRVRSGLDDESVDGDEMEAGDEGGEVKSAEERGGEAKDAEAEGGETARSR